MMITAIVGYKGIKVLSQFGVPLLFLLVIGGVIKTFTVAVSYTHLVNDNYAIA